MASSAAVTVAQLGGRSEIWGRVGSDPAGDQYVSDMRAAGVATDSVRRVTGGREHTSNPTAP